MTLTEVLTGQSAARGKPLHSLYAVTDCKSLFDAVNQTTPCLTEKRTILDVVSIQEVIPPGNFKWVPTTHMLADGLTKVNTDLMADIVNFMKRPVLSLVDTDMI